MRYARSPFTLTADAGGIGSSISPRSASSPARSSSPASGSCSSTTAPSGSPVVVVQVRSTSVTYRLSSPEKHGASLVAAPESSTSSPVANGSSVPVWPVRAPVRRRSAATRANDDGPAGLSSSTTPTGVLAFGTGTGAVVTHELAPEELDDLLDRLLGREARGLRMAAPAPLARDRRDVDLVVARAQRDAPRRPFVPRRLADQRDHLRPFDRAQVVDDPFRERLLGADGGEVAAQQVRDDEAAALEHLRAIERPREQLQLRELHGLVD